MSADWVVVVAGYVLCAATWASYALLLRRGGRRRRTGGGS